jgi:hypothetical protein
MAIKRSRIWPRSTCVEIPSRVTIGPRVRREVENRLRELNAHFKPSAADRKEIHKLEVFLHSMRTGGTPDADI